MSQDLVESVSGIRGIYGQGVTQELARKYVLCYCQLFKNQLSSLVIGGDTRVSTPSLKKAMIEAFKEAGVKKIIDVGIVPVQAAEYAVLKFKAQGGVYISASHNEPQYNGWKLLKEDGALLYPEQSARLIDAVHSFQASNLQPRESKTEIIDKEKETIDEYINFILTTTGEEAVEKVKKSNFRILVDPNGGAGITVLAPLFAQLGVEAKIINNELGKFSRLIEPKPESLLPLAQEFGNNEFEFACGFDADADRVEFVIPPDSDFAREMGPVLDGNYVLALTADTLLHGTENQVVVTNTVTSPLVREVVKKHKATIKEAELGEMYVVKEMEAQKSIVGGEGSNGGVIVPPIKCRDGIMTVVLLLKMLAEKQKPLNEILKDYPKYYSTREALSCSSEKAVDIQDKLEGYFKEKSYQIQRTKDLKVWVDENSYIWFHQSGTEPGTFRVIVDGDNHQKVKQMLQQGVEAFNKFKRL